VTGPVPPTHPALVAAARRLRGHLVATPVIGDLILPGFTAPSDLRIKAEMLQPSGSLWYRGALHWLLCQLGRHKALVHHGGGAAALAWAHAARSTRANLQVRASAPLRAAEQALFAAVGCPVRVGGAAPDGGVPTPALDSAEFADGIGTVVLELAAELPADTQRLVVAPVALTSAVARAVGLLELGWHVVPAPAGLDAESAASALVAGCRLVTHAAGALLHALQDQAAGTCVLLGE
jgi:threonine dehydratase